MKTKKVVKKKTLAYAVALYFTEASIKFMMGEIRCMSMYIPFMTGGMITVFLIRLP